jgi:D-lactate dehydrogenase (cytochrome)
VQLSSPNCRAACLYISHLGDSLLEAVDEVKASGIPYFLVGHADDGNCAATALQSHVF